MYKKILLVTCLLISSLSLNNSFLAEVYLKDSEESVQEDSICSNYEYTLEDLGNTNYKTISIYNEANYLLDMYETNGESSTLVIPNGVDKVKVRVSNLDKEEGFENEEHLSFNVNDCGYDVLKNEYDLNTLNSEFKLSQKQLSFTLSDNLEDYQLYYRTDEKLKGELVTDDTKIEIPTTPYVIQLNEKYNTDDYISNFYEMTIYDENNYTIRQINDFDISQIKAPAINNIYYYILVVLIILFLFFRLKEKRYKKKRKRLMQKRRRKPKKGNIKNGKKVKRKSASNR